MLSILNGIPDILQLSSEYTIVRPPILSITFIVKSICVPAVVIVVIFNGLVGVYVTNGGDGTSFTVNNPSHTDI